jgi:cytochrome c-type biogenesis protein CcsB
MARMEGFMFMAGLICIGISAVLYLFQFFMAGRGRLAAKGAIAGASQGRVAAPPLWDAGRFATMMAVNGLVFLGLSMLFRALITGHGPFSNMYEFSLIFAWGIAGTSLFFQWRYRFPLIGALALPIALAFLLYAYTLPSRALPLVPALQQSLLLTFHVAVAMIAYGAFTIGFGAAVLYLFQRKGGASWLPAPAVLDDIGYRAVIIGFPFQTLVIVLGALWADIAWGRYWGWDPKETASLVTWLIYGAYLHARTLARWRGVRSAILLILGFVAVLVTYFGNYFFGGLHAYQ